MKRSKTNKTDFANRLFKMLSSALVILMLLSALVACSDPENDDPPPPTDEEQIQECIEIFLSSYNQGDLDAVLQCLDAKTRNALQAILNLAGGFAGSQIGFDIDLKDLFSLGVSLTSDDFMKLQIGDITLSDSENAVAVTTMDLTGVGTATIYFHMVYENGGWYIRDMTDSPSSGTDTPGNSGDSGTNDTTIYYLTTYSDTSEHGTAGTYTAYNREGFTAGSTVLLEATVNEGFHFVGWYLSESWSTVCLSTDLTYRYEMKAANATIEARYTYYTVNVHSDSDDYGMAGTYTCYEDQKVSIGDTVILEATVKPGYNFEGWYADWSNVCLSSDLRYEFEMKAENVNIEARYSYYTVTVEGAGDEYGTAGSFSAKSEEKVSIGETVTLTATVNPGYNFEGWYVDWSDVCVSKDMTYSFAMKAENVHIEARYSYYTVTVEGNGDEYGTAGSFSAKNEEKVSIGATVTLTATVNPGYNFEGWYVRWSDVCLSKDLTYSFEMQDENVYLEARYSCYTLTVYDVSGGWFDEFRSSERVSVGEEVALVAKSYNGFRFDGWYINGVCVSTASTYRFEMSARDITIEAIYTYIET